MGQRPSARASVPPLVSEWRAKIVTALALAVLVMAAVAYVPSVWAAIATDQWWIVGFDTVLLAWCVAIAAFRHARPIAAQILALLQLVGVVFLVGVGPLSAGPLFLFVVPILAAALLGMRAAIAALAVEGVILVAVGVSLELGVLGWPYLEVPAVYWMLVGNFLFLNGIASTSIAVLLRGLHDSLSDNRRLAAALEQANELVAIVDTGARVQWTNAAFARAGERSGIGMDALIAIARTQLALDGEETRLSPDLVVRWAVTPLVDPRGRLAEYLVIGRDVTRVSKLQTELAQAQKLEAVGTLAGGIAHDLNNMLTPILANAELARAEAPRDRIEGLDEIVTSAQRARDLVQRILRFSGPRDTRADHEDLAGAVRQEARIVRASLPENVQLVLDVADDECVAAIGRAEVSQVLLNLCSNAAHAMEPDGGTVHVHVERTTGELAAASCPTLDPRRSYALLSVRDHGTGMDAATLARIFDPFFTTKPTGKGTGLGLASVHQIVTRAGGGIHVGSSQPGGSTFRVYVPTAEAKPAVVVEQLPRSIERLSALIVDDDAMVLRSLARMLRSIRLDVYTELDASRVLGRLREERRFDVVITDLSMPSRDGLDLAREIHEAHPDLPVVLMTGRGCADLETRASEAGVTEILMKPFGVDEIERAIERSVRPRAAAG